MFDLNNKTAIVAGGSGLIGRAIVKALKAQHANIFIMDTHFEADINVELKDETALKIILNKYKPDIFINTTYPKNTFDHIVAYLRTTPIIAEYMAHNGGGSIVLLSSIYGFVGCDPRLYGGTDVLQPLFEYHFIKGGINALVKGIATVYGPMAVRCNAVSPGGVFNGQDQKFVERYIEHVPLRRMAKPEDIADAVIFLASDAADYITGENVFVGGGMTAYGWL